MKLAIASSLSCSCDTVSEVLKPAETHYLGWIIPKTLMDGDIEYLFYLDRGSNEGGRHSNFEYVFNELAKYGVTFCLLWAEYCTKRKTKHIISYQHI